MPSADKRQRKKENARMAREAREAAVKRRRRNKTIRNGAIAIAIFVAVVALVSWLGGGKNKKSSTSTSTSTTVATTSTTVKAVAAFKPDPTKTYTADVKTNFGTIVLSLDTKDDPIAAGHFIALAKGGIYNGSRWHRVVKDFVIQGGAPGGNLDKNYGHPVVGELPKDHYPVGSLAAAKTQNDPPGTFDSQFFIVTGAQQGSTLPNDYARFGSVKSGMDVVRKIEALKVDSASAPTTKATIDSITITET